MIVAGIGVVSSGGRGLDAFDQALRRGWVAPEQHPAKLDPDRTVPVYPVPPESLKDRAILRRMRRADAYTRMAVLSAADAVTDSGIEIEPGRHDLGILVASGLGAHVTAFQFLDEMLEFGEAGPSPTLFSHSVQNAAASHIALHLQSHGPAMTLTQFHHTFHQALALASAWLDEGRCKRVLVGATEECGAVMEYVCERRLRLAKNGRIEPLSFRNDPAAVPGEGSVFFLLTKEEPPRPYGRLEVALPGETAPTPRPDLLLLDADGLTQDETAYRAPAEGAARVASYTPVFGSLMTASAFHCAAGALMLRQQTLYPTPAVENPLALPVPAASEPASLHHVSCLRLDCDGSPATITLSS